MDHAVHVLDGPGDLDDCGRVQGRAEAPEDGRRQHRVGGAGLVFEREEAEAPGGAGALPHDRVTRRAHEAPVGHVAQPRCRQHAAPVEIGPQVLQQVRTQGEAAAAVVRQRGLDVAHLGQR